jgi:Ca-activated chloride channel homolog
MRKNIFIIFLLSTSCYSSWQGALRSARASNAYYAEDYNNAAVCYEALLVDNPLDKQAVRGVADCLYEKKDFDAAEKYYRQLIMRLDNDEHEIEAFYFNHGCSLSQLKKFKDALTSFEAVIKINAHNDRAQKNIDVLKKLLEEQKHKDSQKQDQNDNQDKKDQNNKKQDQQDKQNQNSQNDDQENESDNSEDRQSDKEKQKQDKKDQNDLNKEREKDNGQQDKNPQDQKQPDKQKEQKGGNSKEEPQRDEVADKGKEKQQQPHDDSSKHQEAQEKQSQQAQDAGKKQEEQKLPVQMQAILQQAGELEKRGQQLYLRALAGQEETSGADHAW